VLHTLVTSNLSLSLQDGNTALIWAATTSGGRHNVVQLLVEAKANVHHQNEALEHITSPQCIPHSEFSRRVESLSSRTSRVPWGEKGVPASSCGASSSTPGEGGSGMCRTAEERPNLPITIQIPRI